jgi:hypothetical protein
VPRARRPDQHARKRRVGQRERAAPAGDVGEHHRRRSARCAPRGVILPRADVSRRPAAHHVPQPVDITSRKQRRLSPLPQQARAPTRHKRMILRAQTRFPRRPLISARTRRDRLPGRPRASYVATSAPRPAVQQRWTVRRRSTREFGPSVGGSPAPQLGPCERAVERRHRRLGRLPSPASAGAGSPRSRRRRPGAAAALPRSAGCPHDPPSGSRQPRGAGTRAGRPIPRPAATPILAERRRGHKDLSALSIGAAARFSRSWLNVNHRFRAFDEADGPSFSTAGSV